MSSENTVFSKFVGAGRKKYYLDVKRAKNGSMYLTIREVTQGETDDKNESRRIMVFDNAIREFSAAYAEASAKVPPKERSKPEAAAAAF
jgi:hypothetical protein